MAIQWKRKFSLRSRGTKASKRAVDQGDVQQEHHSEESNRSANSVQEVPIDYLLSPAILWTSTSQIA
ncbi:hypothetical protein G7Z17_g12103 [Cylindrodendrum hubeiense]|uniref:Uncharacterized protein n=1 Tax=Cylindrodendrum hubeiense TaxID=595255 RepID=A0A9P5L9L2_9HYPO|nr:hypothetical protein G7Z17_g12103 [Cylindrodendrum hubeiense]